MLLFLPKRPFLGRKAIQDNKLDAGEQRGAGFRPCCNLLPCNRLRRGGLLPKMPVFSPPAHASHPPEGRKWRANTVRMAVLSHFETGGLEKGEEKPILGTSPPLP